MVNLATLNRPGTVPDPEPRMAWLELYQIRGVFNSD